MNLFGPDGNVMMSISAIERDGSDLIVKGKVFGAMPLSARVRPAEARKLLRLLGWRKLIFLISLPLRGS